MYDILRTIEFFGHHISKNVIVSILSLQNDPEENDLEDDPKVSAFCKYAKFG